MKFVSFERNSEASFGILQDEKIIDLKAQLNGKFADLKSFIAADDWRALADQAVAEGASDISMDDVVLLPVIPNPEKIMCVALNYHDHVAEANAHLEGGRTVPEYPMIFTRVADSLVGHNQDIVKPKVSNDLDYEAELLVVIGESVPRYTKAEDALKYVFGYSAMNEGSIRDYQFHSRSLIPGKNFYRTGGVGPWLVTCDEIPDPQVLDIEMRLNGEVLQKANTRDMVFSVAALISYISEWTQLNPGDLIASGTMGGVGFTRKPPIFMKPGDKAEVVISELGTLTNGIATEV
ncbi:fumarylacetoacetate hydrolase family protein [Thioclava sp. BHET1]|nr:fumarylacetoacetate hydrolase family protein [Thioclava sp. BHET1]